MTNRRDHLSIFVPLLSYSLNLQQLRSAVYPLASVGKTLDIPHAIDVENGGSRIAVFLHNLLELTQHTRRGIDLERNLLKPIASFYGGLDVCLQRDAKLQPESNDTDDGAGNSNGLGHDYRASFPDEVNVGESGMTE